MAFPLVASYLLLCWAAGFALTFVSRMDWPLEGRLAIGIPLGFCTSALLTWLVAIPFGMSGAAVALGAAAVALVLVACLRWTEWREPLRAEATGAAARWRTREPLPLLLLFVPMAFFFIGFFTHALEFLPTGLYAGHLFIYYDWNLHMSIAGYLSHAHQLLPPNHPGYNGISLNYPFLADFFSGQLLHLGLDLQTSLPLTSCILSLAFVVILYVTSVRFLASRWAAFVATLLVFLVGGIGFLNLADDIVPTGDGVLGWLGGLGGVLLAPPRNYTWLPQSGIWFGNTVLNYLLPQRSVLFGWPLGLLALSLLWYGWKSNSRREFLLAGIVIGLLPPFHANTFLALFIVAGAAAVLTFRRWRHWAWFFAPAVVLGTPLFYMLLPDPAVRFPFFAFQPGWMAGVPGQEVNWLWFWWINTGLLIPLALVGTIVTWRTRPSLIRLLGPAWILFIVVNVFKLQVWEWDSSKWLIWWVIPASMMVGLLVTKVGSRGRVFAGLAVIVVIFQVFGGFMALNNAFQEKLNNPTLKMLDADEVAVGDWARQQTAPDAIFLSGSQQEHPIRILGSRAMLVSDTGSLWSTDVDYRPRLHDVVTMLQGAPGTVGLLQEYGVNYVLIGPHELTDASANRDYYRRYYRKVYTSPSDEYEIFKVS